MYNYEKQYRAEIESPDYRITLEKLIEWLGCHFEKRILFYAELQRYLESPNEEWRLFDIAVDYSIPVIMVKWFARLHKYDD